MPHPACQRENLAALRKRPGWAEGTVMTGDLPEHVRVLLLNLPHAGAEPYSWKRHTPAPRTKWPERAANLREIYARLHDYALEPRPRSISAWSNPLAITLEWS